ncbi:shematrin-like protein 1 [Bombus impatiens]|uniref:Shematrin-like protein 1 n=1 Tax=Bombus impatiens TaxID=132113 RepID=A0A6P8M2B4_BOMIM|nr:shematrin-like protein 1 [Bombus impatiens]
MLTFLHNGSDCTISGYDLKGSTRGAVGILEQYIKSDQVVCEHTKQSVGRQDEGLQAIYGGYHGGLYGGHLGYPHGVAIAGPALGPTSVAGPHLGATMVAAPSIGPAKLSGSVAGPVQVSGAVAGSAVVTASVAGPAHVEGYSGPYDGGVGLGYTGPAYSYTGYPGYAGYSGYAGAGSHGVVIAGPASHGAVLAGPASHGAVLSGPQSGSAAVSGPNAGSVVIAGPSGKITTHGTGFGGIHTGHGHW